MSDWVGTIIAGIIAGVIAYICSGEFILDLPPSSPPVEQTGDTAGE